MKAFTVLLAFAMSQVSMTSELLSFPNLPEETQQSYSVLYDGDEAGAHRWRGVSLLERKPKAAITSFRPIQWQAVSNRPRLVDFPKLRRSFDSGAEWKSYLWNSEFEWSYPDSAHAH